MKIGLRHNTAMRLMTGSFLVIAVPAVLYVVCWPFTGWRWAFLLPAIWELLMAYGFFFGWRHIIVRRATCTSPLLPLPSMVIGCCSCQTYISAPTYATAASLTNL